MVRGSSAHQAYIVNMTVHDGMTDEAKVKSNTCKKAQAEIIEMIISR